MSVDNVINFQRMAEGTSDEREELLKICNNQKQMTPARRAGQVSLNNNTNLRIRELETGMVPCAYKDVTYHFAILRPESPSCGEIKD